MPLLLQPTPTHGLPVLNKDLIHCDGTPEPRMPAIADFSKFSIVGVELSTSTFAREPISRSPKTRRVRVQSHRHQPVASSLFLKSAVCITGMTGSLRSHYTVASVPVTADRNKRPFNTSVLACITADVRDLKSTGRLHDEDLHGVARFESGVPSSHFDFSVGTGGVY